MLDFVDIRMTWVGYPNTTWHRLDNISVILILHSRHQNPN